MTYRIVFTERAGRELAAAADWWSEHRSSTEAARWYAGFSDAIDALAKFPKRCRLTREHDRFRYEVRELLYGLDGQPTHRALFTIRPDIVLVLAIRHCAQSDVSQGDV